MKLLLAFIWYFILIAILVTGFIISVHEQHWIYASIQFCGFAFIFSKIEKLLN